MENDCLIDSNVYIDLLRSGKDAVESIERWSGESGSRIVICGMVRLEVMRGVQSPRIYRRLAAFMDVMMNVRTTNRLWDAATDLAWKLDRRGFTIPGPDAVIAASALWAEADVMTSDGHFSHVDGLRVIAPPAEWFV